MNSIKKLGRIAVFPSILMLGCNSDSDDGIVDVASDGKSYHPVENLSTTYLDQELDKIIFLLVDLHDVTFNEAIAYAMQRGSELHPRAPFQVPFDIKAEIPSRIKITVQKNDVKFKDLISIICSQADIAWRVDNGVIVFVNGSSARINRLGKENE